MVPYAFATIVWVAPLSQYFFHWGKREIFYKYILGVNPSQLWFLWMLFWVFAISRLLYKVFTDKGILGAFIAIIFYGIGIVGENVFPNLFCIWTSFQFIPYFYIGVQIRIKGIEKKSIVRKFSWWYWVIMDMVLYFAHIYISRTNSLVGKMLDIGIVFFLHVLGAIMAFLVLQKIAEKFDWSKNRVFRTLSSYSMPMYLFHQQMIYFTIYWLNGKINPWLNAGVNFVIAVVGSILISYIFMKFKITRFLVGEK